MTKTTNDPKTVRVLRLSKHADEVLRRHVSRKGDVSTTVNHVIESVDLNNLDVHQRGKSPGSGREEVFATSVKFDTSTYEKATEAAAKRKVSATALIDAAIIAYYADETAAPQEA